MSVFDDQPVSINVSQNKSNQLNITEYITKRNYNTTDNSAFLNTNHLQEMRTASGSTPDGPSIVY